MKIVKGLGSLDRKRKGGDFLFLKPGESRPVRFLLETAEIPVWRRHYLRLEEIEGGFTGYVNCLGPDCILCKKAAEKEKRTSISVARNYFVEKVLDREDDTVKLFEGGESLEDKLISYSKAHDGITGVDFSLSRKKSGTNDIYKLVPIPGSDRPLSEHEQKRAAEVDVEIALRRGEKSEEEILELLGSNEIEEALSILDDKDSSREHGD